jgi:NAD(P)-dependent dehydrogenase (short-subunit alcohol dehydrogenase family)
MNMNTRNQPRGATVVTGGSAGIGKSIVESLLAEGHEVVSLARRRSGIAHARLHEVEVDLIDRQATAQAAADIAQRFELGAIVHNAGIIRGALLSEVKLEDLDDLVNLHLGSAVQLVQAALPGMRERRYGRIVLMSSRAALGAQTRTSYSATKAGMLGMARTWALELAPEGITVNVIAPGPVHSEMFYDVIPAGSEREQKLAASIPVGRIGEPQDVARTVSFFIAPDAGFITGQVLYVCGGASIGSISL